MEASSAGKPHHGHHSSTSKQRHSTGFNKAAYRASITRLENELNSPWTPPSKRFRRDIEEVRCTVWGAHLQYPSHPACSLTMSLELPRGASFCIDSFPMAELVRLPYRP